MVAIWPLLLFSLFCVELMAVWSDIEIGLVEVVEQVPPVELELCKWLCSISCVLDEMALVCIRLQLAALLLLFKFVFPVLPAMEFVCPRLAPAATDLAATSWPAWRPPKVEPGISEPANC